MHFKDPECWSGQGSNPRPFELCPMLNKLGQPVGGIFALITLTIKNQ